MVTIPRSTKLEQKERYCSGSNESSKCETCGLDFKSPLETSISVNSQIEEYYACPRCLSKMGGVYKVKNNRVDEAKRAVREGLIATSANKKTEKETRCLHTIGYLKKRPKDTPIPEECFTCFKMIECASY